MKNGQNHWVSEYRRRKFMERQKKKPMDTAISYLDITPLKVPTEIAVMLDLDGTVDCIDDEKAKRFQTQLDLIRQKFASDTAFIAISTHYEDSVKMKKVLDIFARTLLPNIKIGMSFYFGGMYDYEKDLDIPCSFGFNRDKVATFDNYYNETLGRYNKWIAIIDDGIGEDSYIRYQDSHPMLLGLPSNSENSVSKNNFMRRATTTRGFDGVLEIMDSYLEDIKNLSSLEIFHTQRTMIMHLSSFELVEKIRKRDYAFLERYFEEGYADEEDYQDTLSWLFLTTTNTYLSRGEIVSIGKVVDLLVKHFQEKNNEQAIERSSQFQKKLKEQKWI